MNTALEQHIAIDSNIRFGKPCVAGTRIAVSDIVVWHLYLGMAAEQIAGDYRLSLADVHAALTYYYDHRAEIDAKIAADEEAANRFMAENPSKLGEMIGDRRGS